MVASAAEEHNGLLLTAAEVAFLAEEELVEVQPRATLNMLHLISNDYGPIRPNETVKLPMWLALHLRKAHYCRIVTPSWMHVAHLEALVDMESVADSDFAPLPLHYVEVADALLEVASEDVLHAERVRVLVQTLRELRHGKFQSGLALLDGSPIKLNHASHMELNELRPVLLNVLSQISHFSDASVIEQQRMSTMAAASASSLSLDLKSYTDHPTSTFSQFHSPQ